MRSPIAWRPSAPPAIIPWPTASRSKDCALSRIGWYRTWSDGNATVTLVLAVDAVDLGVSADAAGATLASIEVHAAALDNEGRVVAELTDAMNEVAGANSAAAMGRGLVIRRYGLEIDPGQYDLRVMVLNATTGRVGATQLDLSVPERRGGDWFTGDPMLVRRLPDRSFEPVVSGRILQGNPVTAQIEVYGGQRPEMSARIERLGVSSSSTEAGDAAETQILPRPLVLAEDGIHRGALPVPRLPAGDYVLHLRITESGSDREQSFDLPMHVVAAVRAR